MDIKEEIKKKIERNREQINNLLNSDLPPDILYINIRMLAYNNEQLIKKLNKID